MKTPPAFRPRTLIPAALVLALLGPAVGCTLYRIERELPEKYAAFLNDVRYLITSPERKTFLYTPDSDKDRFIEDFWLRRDPDPDTADNEVRTEYYSRIEKANELFRGEGMKGWMTDRGRVFVLYGPPDLQQVSNIGMSATPNCRQVWYYHDFPVVFRDEACSGNFRLISNDLTPINYLSLNQPPAKAEPEGRGGRPGEPGSRPPGPPGGIIRGARPTLDFAADIRTTVRRDDRVVGVLRLEVPIRLIWFKAEGGRFFTTFEVALKVRDAGKVVVLEKTDSAGAEYPESEIKIRSGENHVIEIPILVDRAESIARLAAGPATIEVKLTNQTGSESVSKTIEWK